MKINLRSIVAPLKPSSAVLLNMHRPDSMKVYRAVRERIIPQTPSQGKRYKGMHDKGYCVHLIPKRCRRQVKPRPGEKNREQGFAGGTTSRPNTSIKDTKKYFKEQFFMGH